MTKQQEMPHEKGLDNTLTFLKEGYLYISNRRNKLDSDIFTTRVLGGKEVICMAGKEAAEVFYDNARFKRDGAAPNRVLDTLFGQDGIQTLDGQAHEHRKTMFMDLMTKDSLKEIADLVEEEWMNLLPKWEQEDSVELYEESKKILTMAVSRWVGIPLGQYDMDELSKQLADMFESAEKIGPEHMKGKHSRNKVESWIKELIDEIRSGRDIASIDTPLHKIAMHKDLSGELLDINIAAVEVLNLLRPTVAISVYAALSGLALHDFPEKKTMLKKNDETYYKMFVQEIRRYYPFFPVAPAVVKKDFIWNGYEFKEDTLVLLDLYGNNHHPDLWENPKEFHPERFENWDQSPFDLIPQGGGEFLTGHRCAGEWLTIEVMKKCLDILVNKMEYTVPSDQDFDMKMNEMPSIPKSGFVIKNIKRL